MDVFALIGLNGMVAEDLQESGGLNVIELLEEIAVALFGAAGDLFALDLAGQCVVHLQTFDLVGWVAGRSGKRLGSLDLNLVSWLLAVRNLEAAGADLRW